MTESWKNKRRGWFPTTPHKAHNNEVGSEFWILWNGGCGVVFSSLDFLLSLMGNQKEFGLSKRNFFCMRPLILLLTITVGYGFRNLHVPNNHAI